MITTEIVSPQPLSSAVAPGRQRRSSRTRAGGAVLEMVLVIPILLYLAFGLVEFGQYIFIQHTFEAAARDAARVAILPTATQTQVTSTISGTMTQANVTYNSSWLTITDLGPSTTGTVSNVANVPMGDLMQLTISTTYGNIPNAVRPLYWMTGTGVGSSKSVIGECTMVKE